MNNSMGLFGEADAKLSHDFAASLSDDVDKIGFLMELSASLPISVMLSESAHDPQPFGVRGSFSVLMQMQRKFAERLFPLRERGTQTDLMSTEGGIPCSAESSPPSAGVSPQTEDVAVECRILEPPVFTKCGRPVRSRYSDIYTSTDSIDTDDVVIHATHVSTLKPESVRNRKTGRKRGRPPKLKPVFQAANPNMEEAGETADPAMREAGETADPAMREAGETADPAMRVAGETADPAMREAGETADPAILEATGVLDLDPVMREASEARDSHKREVSEAAALGNNSKEEDNLATADGVPGGEEAPRSQQRLPGDQHSEPTDSVKQHPAHCSGECPDPAAADSLSRVTLPRQLTEPHDRLKQPRKQAAAGSTPPVTPSRQCKASQQNRTDKIRQQKLEYEQRTPFKYKCTVCSFQTKRKSHLERHKEYHEMKKCTLYECHLCEYKTIRLALHTKHMAEQHGQAPALTCSLCPYTCLAEQTLSNHYKVKHGAAGHRLHRCDKCDYYTPSLQLYKRHRSCHTVGVKAERTFACDKCPYKTDKKALYKQHARSTHSDARPHVCDVCGMCFKRKHGMLQHKSFLHQDKKKTLPFKCDECDKLFRSMAHLKEHSMRHSSERKFLCHVCGAKFKTKSSQKRHYDALHHARRAYACRKCSKTFHVRATLVRHQRLECKRKPRKDAFGFVHTDFLMPAITQKESVPMTVETLPSVTTFKLNQNNLVELHRFNDNSFIELQEPVIVQETQSMDSQPTSFILQDSLAKEAQGTTFLHQKKADMSEVAREAHHLPLNSGLTQQLILSSNSASQQAVFEGGPQPQTVITLIAEVPAGQYLGGAGGQARVSETVVGLSDLHELGVLSEASIGQGALAEGEAASKEVKYYTYVCEKAQ